MGEPKKPIRVIADLDALEQAAGTTLGASDWIEVTQQRIDTFAEATDDHQWIHVDPQRAESGPFGTTIAHGYFTLSLVPTLLGQILRINGVSATINYGVNRARFPAPVPVGSHLSGTLSLISVDRAAGKATATFSMVIERQGATSPSVSSSSFSCSWSNRADEAQPALPGKQHSPLGATVDNLTIV